jgi:hypothetical protein
MFVCIYIYIYILSNVPVWLLDPHPVRTHWLRADTPDISVSMESIVLVVVLVVVFMVVLVVVLMVVFMVVVVVLVVLVVGP